jgi:hypothetical protein
MASFTIRMVLHDYATALDYQLLSNALALNNITDVVMADNGTRWKMPPGEYQFVGNLTIQQVHNICASAANSTRKRHSILITELGGRFWTGLEQVS